MKLFPKTPMGRRLMLDKDARDWKSTDVAKRDLAGKEGIAHTMLRPVGTAVIAGQRLDVVTRGEIIEANTPVKVIEVEGNRVVVTALH
jgi:membrane-bound ClpP family serine protease